VFVVPEVGLLVVPEVRLLVVTLPGRLTVLWQNPGVSTEQDTHRL